MRENRNNLVFRPTFLTRMRENLLVSSSTIGAYSVIRDYLAALGSGKGVAVARIVFSAFDWIVVPFCLLGLLLGYAVLASPVAMAGWLLFAGAIAILATLLAGTVRFALTIILKRRYDAGMASGGWLILTASWIEITRLIAWRTGVAATGFTVGAVLILIAGSWVATIVVVMLVSGFAMLSVGLLSPGRPGAGMALLRFMAPRKSRLAKACRVVFLVPARITEARRRDAVYARVSGCPPTASLLEINLRRYRSDGRGALPPLDAAPGHSAVAEASGIARAFVAFGMYMLPIAVLFAVLGFPFSDRLKEILAPLIPDPPLAVASEDPPEALGEKGGSDESEDSGDAGGLGTGMDDRVSNDAGGSSATAGEQGFTGDGATSGDGIGKSDGDGRSAGSLGGNTPGGNGQAGNARGGNGQVESAQTGSSQTDDGQAGDDQGGNGGASNAQPGTYQATNNQTSNGQGGNGQVVKDQRGNRPGDNDQATSGRDEAEQKENRQGEGGQAGGGTGGNAAGEAGADGVGRSAEGDEDGAREPGAGDQRAQVNTHSSAGDAPQIETPKSETLGESVARPAEENGDSVAGDTSPGMGGSGNGEPHDGEASAAIGSTEESGQSSGGDPVEVGIGDGNLERRPFNEYGAELTHSRPVPPSLGDPVEIYPDTGDELVLESSAAQFGEAGGPPEALRVHRGAGEIDEAGGMIERNANPEQHLPAWIGRVLGRSIRESANEEGAEQ